MNDVFSASCDQNRNTAMRRALAGCKQTLDEPTVL